jgi:hypothetical protein
MARFEPWPESTIPNFTANTAPQPGVSQLNNARSFFMSQLKLETEQVLSICIRESSLTILEVRSDNPRVADVALQFVLGNTPVYRVTAKQASGTALIQARISSADVASLADLRVTVELSKDRAKQAVKFLDPNHLADEFAAGFREGLATINPGGDVDIVNRKIRADVTGFYFGYVKGCIVGFIEGLKSLVELIWSLLKIGLNFTLPGLIVNSVRLAVDPAFREQIKAKAAWAKSVADAANAAAKEFYDDQTQGSNKFELNTRVAGSQLGRALAQEIDGGVAKKTASQMGEWVGWIVGRVVFEVVFLMFTAGLGQGARGGLAVGEGGGIIARMLPRLRSFLEGLPALRRLIETIVEGRSAANAAQKAAEVARGAEAAEKAAEAVAKTIRPRASVAQLRRMLAEHQDWWVHTTPKGEVAMNQAIQFLGENTPGASRSLESLAPERVYVIKGLEGLPYGRYRVAVPYEEFKNASQVSSRDALEHVLDRDIPADKGVWYTKEDLEEAKALLKGP